MSMDRLERLGSKLDQVLARFGYVAKNNQKTFERRGYHLGRGLYRIGRGMHRLGLRLRALVQGRGKEIVSSTPKLPAVSEVEKQMDVVVRRLCSAPRGPEYVRLEQEMRELMIKRSQLLDVWR